MELRQFYATPLGSLAAGLIGLRLQDFWPEAGEDGWLALGYAMPYLSQLGVRPERVVMAMPAGQGALYWPPEGANHTVLVDELALPLPDKSVNRALVVHAVEHGEPVDRLMQELWRVLVPSGRVLLVVPNRRSLWALAGNTPFCYGRPFSHGQLKHLLIKNRFACLRSCHALFTPPSETGLNLKLSRMWEFFGRSLGFGMGGVVVMEGEKQIYATTRLAVHTEERQPIYAPAPKPAMFSRN